MLDRRTSIERWARANGISSFLLAVLIHHEGGAYLDPLRRGGAQTRDRIGLAVSDHSSGEASVGLAQVRVGTAAFVLRDRFCSPPDMTDGAVGERLINSDDFSIGIAAGYLRTIKNEFPSAPDSGLFLAYAATYERRLILESLGWNVQGLTRAMADFRTAASGSGLPVYGVYRLAFQTRLGVREMKTTTANTLIRRYDHWLSSAGAMRSAGW